LSALRVSWVDVFTDRPFAGNRLAVVLDADPLDAAEMQTLAAELNLPETTFVLEGGGRLRIFAPAMEMPLAGHPVVGATVELGRLGLLDDGEHVFRTAVGDTPVELRDGVATMTQPDLRVHRELDPAFCASLLGLDPGDVTGRPVVCETAVPQGFAQVLDADALGRARPDLDGISRFDGDRAIGLAAWCERGGELGLRFFAPRMGIVEDPATGSAAGALGALRVLHGAAPGRITVRQGEHVGRPSTMHVEVGGNPGSPSGVRVGGTAVPVLEATIELERLHAG
jgi:trans-2,3-dihydro-3-hydroxyanthranilate isomerase